MKTAQWLLYWVAPPKLKVGKNTDYSGCICLRLPTSNSYPSQSLSHSHIPFILKVREKHLETTLCWYLVSSGTRLVSAPSPPLTMKMLLPQLFLSLPFPFSSSPNISFSSTNIAAYVTLNSGAPSWMETPGFSVASYLIYFSNFSL